MADAIIFGSCVTRDTFEFSPPPGVDLRLYIARQSWCSVGKNCELKQLRSAKLHSQFAQTNFIGDLQGDALRRIERTLIRFPEAFLLIDLVDERGGFWQGPRDEVATFNYEGAHAGLYQEMPEGWHRVKFGTIPYGLAFLESSQRLKNRLSELKIWDRTAIVAARWALETDRGEPAGSSMQLEPAKANEYYDAYYGLLETEGWQLLRPSESEPVAHENHKWGKAPFHYGEDHYHSLSEAISEFVRSGM